MKRSCAILSFILCSNYIAQSQNTNNHNHLKEIDEYEDGKIVSKNFVDINGVLMKIESIDKSPLGTVELFHYKEGKFDSLSVQDTTEDKEFSEHYYGDIQVMSDELKEHNIIIPCPFLHCGEIHDLSNMLSIPDSFIQKKEGVYRTIIFRNISENIRFVPSLIERYIPQNTFITGYELKLRNDTVVKEEYKFADGKLVKSYTYKAGQLVKIFEKANYKNDKKAYTSTWDYKTVMQ